MMYACHHLRNLWPGYKAIGAFYKSPCNKRIVIIRINAMANGEVRCNDLMINLCKVVRCFISHLLSTI